MHYIHGSMLGNMKGQSLHAYYHDIILSLLPFVVYSWHAMNSTKSAAVWMFNIDTKVTSKFQLQSCQKGKM
jgi:hypothetical protein